jgi:hypothetical protein
MVPLALIKNEEILYQLKDAGQLRPRAVQGTHTGEGGTSHDLGCQNQQ